MKLLSLNRFRADAPGHTNVCVNPLVSNRWVVLAVLFLARTAMGIQFQSVATLSPYLISKLSIDYTQLGLLIGVYLLPGIVIAYPGGLLGQRFGDKRITILGMGLMVAGGLLTGISHDYTVFLVGRLISGIGAVLLNVLLTKMAADWFASREVGTALALLVSSWPIGIGLALVVLPRAAEASSAAAAFIMTAVAAGMILLLLAAIYRVPNAANKAPLAGASGFGLSGQEFGLVSLAGVVWALFNSGYIILISFAPSLLIAQGMSVKNAAIATSFASWTLVPTIALGGLLVDRIGYATAVMTTSLAIVGLSIMLMPSDSTIRANGLYRCSWWPSLRRNARSAGGGASSPKSCSRDGNLLYLVLCRNGAVDPGGRVCSRFHWRSRRALDFCWPSGDCGDCGVDPFPIIAAPLRSAAFEPTADAAV